MSAAEGRDGSSYSRQPESAKTLLAPQERSHAKVIQEILRTSNTGAEGSLLANLESRHRASGGNALRAAVLGANDGLCSNLSLVMGVAGASYQGKELLLTGLAGLLAGALSMALGEYVSVTSARELAKRELDIEADELASDPESEAKELQLIYQAKGLDEQEARRMAQQLLRDPGKALDTLAREELGIDPQDLGGSAWEAAITSFLLFAIGAVLPVIPFFFAQGTNAVIASIVLGALGLFGMGGAITLFTGRSIWFSGGRQLLLGLLAASTTFMIGRLIGTVIH
jgi:VIT1/CCC1 family predicted Fe2+/Mn2+ transporter